MLAGFFFTGGVAADPLACATSWTGITQPHSWNFTVGMANKCLHSGNFIKCVQINDWVIV